MKRYVLESVTESQYLPLSRLCRYQILLEQEMGWSHSFNNRADRREYVGIKLNSLPLRKRTGRHGGFDSLQRLLSHGRFTCLIQVGHELSAKAF